MSESDCPQIVEQKGDYVLTLKSNHANLAEDVCLLFGHSDPERPCSVHTTMDTGHRHKETRTCSVLHLADLAETWDDVAAEWSKLTSLVQITSKRQVGDKVSEETRYYLSSLSSNAEAHLKIIRSHWEIENCVHWVLDVVMHDDASRIRKENAPQNMATMRHLALNLVRQENAHK